MAKIPQPIQMRSTCQSMSHAEDVMVNGICRSCNRSSIWKHDIEEAAEQVESAESYNRRSLV